MAGLIYYIIRNILHKRSTSLFKSICILFANIFSGLKMNVLNIKFSLTFKLLYTTQHPYPYRRQTVYWSRSRKKTTEAKACVWYSATIRYDAL